MRCFLKGSRSSPLVEFSSLSEDTNDLGDGGGIPAFLFWPITTFGIVACKTLILHLVFCSFFVFLGGSSSYILELYRAREGAKKYLVNLGYLLIAS